MYDVVALGECLIDFTPQGKSDRGNDIFEKNPGGAPANVLAFLSKLDKKTGFIGKVGKDQFGLFLKDVLIKNGIDTHSLKEDENVNTTLAFVHLHEDGDRDFSFYRKPGADINLKIEDVDFSMIDNTKIFHFGSLSLTDNPARETTFMVLDYAKEKGITISYDPNLRIPLWSSLDFAKEMIIKGLEYANIVKISEEELEFITGKEEIEEGSKIILDTYSNIELLLVTLGSKGSYFNSRNYEGYVDTIDVKVIDTTGAGDSFFGGVLYCLLEKAKKISELTKEELEEILLFANAGASIVTSRYGAISSMPIKEEIENLILIYKYS